MNVEVLLFYIFSAIAIISGSMVISARNPIHSVLFLVLVFCNAAGLLILLETEFLAMLFLVVYVGAIAVLRVEEDSELLLEFTNTKLTREHVYFIHFRDGFIGRAIEHHDFV
jgi:NADH-quinone oxidoreductase subunit J